MSSPKEETVLEGYVSYGRGGAGNCRKFMLSLPSVHQSLDVALYLFSKRPRFSKPVDQLLT